MKNVFNARTLISIAYGAFLGALLLIAVCELIGGASGTAEFRYQAF